MLDRKRRLQWIALAVLLIIFLVVLFATGAIPLHAEICEQTKNSEREKCATYNIALFLWRQVGEFLEGHNGAITAIATAVIAAFTIGLKRATDKLWSAAERQSNDAKAAIEVAKEANRISRENADAARRAWLSISDVSLKYPTRFVENEATFAIDVEVTNVGQTPAKNVEVKYMTHFQREGGNDQFRADETRFKGILRNHPGQLGHCMFPRDVFVQGQTWTEGSDKLTGVIKATSSGEKKFGFIMFIGVTYRIAGDDSPHITYYPCSMLNVPVPTQFAKGDRVKLPRMPFIAGEVD